MEPSIEGGSNMPISEQLLRKIASAKKTNENGNSIKEKHPRTKAYNTHILPY